MVEALDGPARGAISIVLFALILSGCAQAQSDTDAEESPVLLSVQTAQAGSFLPVAGDDPARHTLTLTGVSPVTVLFSDRPQRIFFTLNNERFLETFSFSDPATPNAVVVLSEGEAASDVIVVELLEAAYDEATLTLTYEVVLMDEIVREGLRHIEERVDATLPETFGFVSVFIDGYDCGNNLTPC